MTKKEENTMMTFLAALFVAEGDTQKAEEYFKWAAGKAQEEKAARVKEKAEKPKKTYTRKARAYTPGQFTENFIRLYLTPKGQIGEDEAMQFARNFVNKQSAQLDYAAIFAHIQKMPYKDFISTVYWKGVAYAVKQRAWFACEICGAKTTLAAHHKTYEHHGDEIHHLEDLQCVCKDCHEKIHAKLTDIQMEEE